VYAQTAYRHTRYYTTLRRSLFRMLDDDYIVENTKKKVRMNKIMTQEFRNKNSRYSKINDYDSNNNSYYYTYKIYYTQSFIVCRVTTIRNVFL